MFLGVSLDLWDNSWINQFANRYLYRYIDESHIFFYFVCLNKALYLFLQLILTIFLINELWHGMIDCLLYSLIKLYAILIQADAFSNTLIEACIP